jgi:hypothetical protein
MVAAIATVTIGRHGKHTVTETSGRHRRFMDTWFHIRTGFVALAHAIISEDNDGSLRRIAPE